MKNLLMLASVTCLVCVMAVASISARTWRVNQQGTGDAPTIQAAVDSSAAGDTILVAPGSYIQSTIQLNLDDSLTIMSEAGAEATVLRSSAEYIMDVAWSDHVTVRGFLFENSGSGLLLYWSAYCSIEENIFRNNTGEAIAGDVSGPAEITNNLIYSNGGGIYFGDASGGITLTNNTIAHNAQGAGFSCDGPGLYLYCNIIAYNNFGVEAFCNVYQCNDVFGNGTNYIMDPGATNGNISLDPLFCGANPELSGNYYLQGASPCAPGNRPDGCSCEVIGRSPVKCEVSVQKRSWGSIKEMYR